MTWLYRVADFMGRMFGVPLPVCQRCGDRGELMRVLRIPYCEEAWNDDEPNGESWVCRDARACFVRWNAKWVRHASEAA